jgi:hypothetical protein
VLTSCTYGRSNALPVAGPVTRADIPVAVRLIDIGRSINPDLPQEVKWLTKK